MCVKEYFPPSLLQSLHLKNLCQSFPVVKTKRGRDRVRSHSTKDYPKKPGKKGHIQPPIQDAKMDDSFKLDGQPRSGISGIKDEKEKHLLEVHLTDSASLEFSSQPVPLQPMELKPDQELAMKVTATNMFVPLIPR